MTRPMVLSLPIQKGFPASRLQSIPSAFTNMMKRKKRLRSERVSERESERESESESESKRERKKTEREKKIFIAC